MALSAYREGRLKKNPLLGTSLAVDPTRPKMREGFMDLYKEAKTDPGAGRAGMLQRLSQRYANLGAEHTPRFSQISEEMAKLQGEASSYADPEEMARLQKRATIAQKVLKDYESLPKKKQKKGYGLPDEYGAEIAQAWRDLPSDDPLKMRARGDKKLFQREYLNKMAEDYPAYRQAAQAKIDALNQSRYLPLQQEEALRRKTLNDRADLFNAFLGMD